MKSSLPFLAVLIYLVVVLPLPILAQQPPISLGPVPPHGWSKRFGDARNDDGFAVAVDSNGNVLVTGQFVDTVDFGGGPLTSAGEPDIFVAKFAPNGTHLWSKRFGGVLSDRGLAIAVDASGDVVLCGWFIATVDFGGGPLTSISSAEKIFVAKLAGADGSHLWSKNFGRTVFERHQGLAVDSEGDVVVAGYFAGTANFGGGPVTSVGVADIFVAKLSGADGSHVWSKHFGDINAGFDTRLRDAGVAAAVDSKGNVVLAGLFEGVVEFGGGPLTSAGFADIFIAKFAGADGTHLWSKRFGDTSMDFARGVAVDSTDNVLVTGAFNGTVDFGGDPLINTRDVFDVFLAKFAPDGAHLWSRHFTSGTVTSGTGFGVAVDANGDPVVTGIFGGAVDFGGGPLTNAGFEDIFVAKLSGADGAHLWSQRIGGMGGDYGLGVAVDPRASVLVTGYFFQTVDFGGGPLTSAGFDDIFLLKLGMPPQLVADYKFQTTLASDLAGAPDLSPIGTNTFINESVGGTSHTVLDFPAGNGVELAGATSIIPADAYTIAVEFRFDSTAGPRRLLDFKSGAANSGLYNLSGALNFFPVATGPGGAFAPNTYAQVVLTRDAARQVVGYVNGVQQFSFTDTSDLAVIDASDRLRFFQDDMAVPGEDSGGAVARVRLFTGALSPDEVAALDRFTGPLDEYALSMTPHNRIVRPGQMTTFTVTVTPAGAGFAAPITFSVTGLPARTTFSFSPNPLTPGTSAASTTLTISTTAASASLRPPGKSGTEPTLLALWLSLCGLAGLGLVIERRNYGTLRLRLFLAMLLGLLLLFQAACGSGSPVAPRPPAQSQSGTPTGRSTVTITATSGARIHSTTVTFVVL